MNREYWFVYLQYRYCELDKKDEWYLRANVWIWFYLGKLLGKKKLKATLFPFDCPFASGRNWTWEITGRRTIESIANQIYKRIKAKRG